MRWELWVYGVAQLVAAALLFAEVPGDLDARTWVTRAVDYGLYVAVLTILYRQFKQSSGGMPRRRLVQYGIYSAVVLFLKYAGSWFYMEKTSISIAAIGAGCLYALWYFVVIGIVSLLWYGAVCALHMARDGASGNEHG